jgi:glucose-6-phosphate isomerase
MEINFVFNEETHSFDSTEIDQLRNHLNSITSRDDIGFYSGLSSTKHLEETKLVYQKFSHKKKFFHIGIEGSSLGPEMLLSALEKKNKDVDFTFINNIDPDEINEQISTIKDPSHCLFYIVSKSGGTSETIAAAIIVINILKDKFGIEKENLKDYIVLCTDPENGDLRKLSKKLDLSALEVPSNIGGRFSVMTPVGFLPALFSGIEVEKIIISAKNFAKKELESGSLIVNTALQLDKLNSQNGISQTVLMPYSSRLKNFSSWFVQLWAESLGKRESLTGEIKNTGFTPIQSYGATDQHSQMQLFVEGPADKAIILLSIKKFIKNIPLKNDFDLDSFQSLNNFSLNELMQAEFYGAKQTLIDQNRPLFHLEIESLNEESLGELIIFFELLTVAQGHLLNIDPFNQPGVESGKIYTKKWLNNQL